MESAPESLRRPRRRHVGTNAGELWHRQAASEKRERNTERPAHSTHQPPARNLLAKRIRGAVSAQEYRTPHPNSDAAWSRCRVSSSPDTYRPECGDILGVVRIAHLYEARRGRSRPAGGDP